VLGVIWLHRPSRTKATEQTPEQAWSLVQYRLPFRRLVTRLRDDLVFGEDRGSEDLQVSAATQGIDDEDRRRVLAL